MEKKIEEFKKYLESQSKKSMEFYQKCNEKGDTATANMFMGEMTAFGLAKEKFNEIIKSV